MTTENATITANQPNQTRLETINKLMAKRDDFVTRLDTGAAKIEEARSAGQDVTVWEDFWIDLLRQYGAVCEQLRNLHLQRNDDTSQNNPL